MNTKNENWDCEAYGGGNRTQATISARPKPRPFTADRDQIGKAETDAHRTADQNVRTGMHSRAFSKARMQVLM